MLELKCERCLGSEKVADESDLEVECAVDKNHCVSHDVFIALAKNKNYILMIAKEYGRSRPTTTTKRKGMARSTRV